MRVLFAWFTLAIVSAPSATLAQNLGSAVATNGREAFVGEPVNQYSPGYVHVFQRAADGTWQVGARLAAPDGHNLDRFGRSLSVDGDRLLVGTTSIDESRGAAYVFERGGAGAWEMVAKLVASDVTPGEAYGRQVLLSGDRAYVASWGRKESRGGVVIWRRAPDGGWSEEAVVSASDGRPGDFFGSGLALDHDVLAVGASQRDSARGAGYVFRRDGEGAWREEARLDVQGLTRFTRLGAAVAQVNGEILLGAPGAEQGRGAIIVFGREASGAWVERQRITASTPLQNAQFGGTLLVVGREVWAAAVGTEQGRGAVHRLARGPDGRWSATGYLTHTELDRGNLFGFAMAATGDLAVIGFPGDDHGMGTAAVFSRTGSEWAGGRKIATEAASLAAITGGRRECAEGTIGPFGCDNVELLSFLPVSAIGGGRGIRLNDVWGWADPTTGREYALVGRIDGTSFVDVTDPVNPVYLGDLPKTEGSPAAMWRDIKVYRDHAYIVADGSEAHGMQVFDLTRLRGVGGAPQTFTPDARYDRIHSSHNIVIDTASGYAYAVGANGGGETCGGALHMIDIRDPKRPAFAGCFADPTTGNQRTGYTHDAQCVVYHGPDARYAGRQICFNASENAIGIADVTDKANPSPVATAAYPNVGYTHQGWLTDDMRYFYVNDEGDELAGTVQGTRTLIWDVSDLREPILAGEYVADNRASDHNLYVRGNLMFQSNYASGLRVFDISVPDRPRLVGFLDTHPVGVDAPGFVGSWSNYPYLPSGTVLVSSIQEGLFMVRPGARPLVP